MVIVKTRDKKKKTVADIKHNNVFGGLTRDENRNEKKSEKTCVVGVSRRILYSDRYCKETTFKRSLEGRMTQCPFQ